MNFLVGLILIATGILVLKFRYQVYHFTGDWDWASRYLGSNGTIVAISLFGAGLIFVGVAFPLGAFEDEKKVDTNGTVIESTVNPFGK